MELRAQCGQGDEAAGEKRLHAGDEAGRFSDAERAAQETPRRYVGLVAPPRTKRSIGARAANAARPSLAPPAEDQNTQTKHPGMARFAHHA